MITLEYIGHGKKYPDAVRVSFPYNPALVAGIKSMGQRQYDPDTRSWEIPVGQVAALLRLWHDQGVRVDDRLAAKLEKKPIKERLEGIRPVIPFRFKTEPFPHQIEGFNYGWEHDVFLLADEQGLGKTKQAVDIAVARKLAGCKACLIVCGVNGLRKNWEREVAIHSDEQSITFKGSGHERWLAAAQWFDDIIAGKDVPYFGIVNIETLRGEKVEAKDKRRKFDYVPSEFANLMNYMSGREWLGMVIVDEIHKAKNATSLQGIAIKMLQPKARMGLTGTPLLSKPEELWNLLVWLGVEKRSFWLFRDRYCIMGGYGNKQVVGYKNQDELHELLSSCMLRRLKEEVLNLPPKIHQTIYVEMSDKHRRVYERIKLGIVAALGEYIDNPLLAVLRLRQCTGGLLQKENPKLDRLEELLDEQIIPSGKKALVFSNWTEVTEPVRKRLERFNPAYIVGEVDGDTRDAEKERFQNDPACKVCIGTIGAMGTGWTLTAANYVIFLDKAWTPADNEQAEDRAHRIGTTDTVFVISLVCEDSVDENIEQVLLNKRELFNQIVEGKLPRMSRKGMTDLLMEMLGISDLDSALF